MNSALANVETAAPPIEGKSEMEQARSLPSGRSVLLKVTSTGEELQIRSPTGDVEVRITLGEGGPIVHLSGARLELETPDTLALNCRRLEVKTEETIDLKSAGDMRVRTTGDIHMNGEIIRLNC